jgi:hypothetical protein
MVQISLGTGEDEAIDSGARQTDDDHVYADDRVGPPWDLFLIAQTSFVACVRLTAPRLTSA